VLKGVGHGSTEDLAQAEAKIPEGEARGLLGLGVPLAADEDERGADGGLEDSEKYAGDE